MLASLPILRVCMPLQPRNLHLRRFGARVLKSQGSKILQSDYALVLYEWRRPRSFMERCLSLGGGDAPKVYYMRAVARDWSTTESIEIGTSDENALLSLPLPVDAGPYDPGGSKLAPGVLANFRLPGHYYTTAAKAVEIENQLRVQFQVVQSEFKGILLGWDEQDYFVWPMPTTEFQTYDTAKRAVDLYDVQKSLRVPRAYFLNAGQPEVQVFSVLPFGVYAAFAVNTSFSRIQVLLDDEEMDVTQQTKLLPRHLFSEKQDSTVGPMAEQAGLVLSRVSILVDGVKVPMFVPLCNLC